MVNSTLELQTVLTTIVTHAVELSGLDAGMIHEYDEDAGYFIVRATHGMDGRLVSNLLANPVQLGEGAAGRSAVLREPVAFPDIEAGTYDPRLKKILLESGFKAILNVPLLRGNQIYGGLSVCRKKAGDFAPQIVDLLRTFATQSVLAIQNAPVSGARGEAPPARNCEQAQIAVPGQHEP